MKKKKSKKKRAHRGLTFKQQGFVDNYEGNAYESAKKAGYKGTEGALRVTASRLLTNANILDAIEKRQKKEKDALNATRSEKLEILSEFIRDKTTFVTKIDGGLEEITPNVEIKDRIKSIELHSKISGHLVQKHEHTGEGGGPIETANRNLEITPEMDAKEASRLYAEMIRGTG
jgi:phage terminase small subunit